AEMRRPTPVFPPPPRIALARSAATKQTVQIADVQAEPGYLDPLPGFSGPQIVTLGGPRTVVARPNRGGRTDAQEKRADRRHCDLSPRGAPLYRQADRAG